MVWLFMFSSPEKSNKQRERRPLFPGHSAGLPTKADQLSHKSREGPAEQRAAGSRFGEAELSDT